MSESKDIHAEIIAIGDELLLGHIVNGNAATLGRALTGAGVLVQWSSMVADDTSEIQAALALSVHRSRVIILTGGLGPTPDDITKAAVADYFRMELEMRPDILEAVQTRFASFGRTMPEASRNQAIFPRGATIIPNPKGTAPGIHISHDGREVFVFPGVPHELENMIQDYLLPWLQDNLTLQPVRSKTLQTTGLGESFVLERLQHLKPIAGKVQVAFLPSPGSVTLRLTAKSRDAHEAEAQLAEAEGFIRGHIGEFVFASGDQSLAEVIANILTNRCKTVAVAESCTGGLIAHMLTNIPGSSSFFERGFVTYSNESKMQLLGVPEKLFIEHGSVSEDVARAMAEGARTKAGTDYGLSTTGIAGPSGGTEEKPVGTLWIAVTSAKETQARHLRAGYDRDINKKRFAEAALFLFYKHLLQEND